MNVRKITIIGNSVALRNRPHLKEKSKNYGELLQKKINLNATHLTLVENLAFGRATMNDLEQITDQIINSFGDIYVINIGASDAATREIPYWFANILNRRKETLTKKIFKGFHQYFFLKNRRFWVILRGKKSWVTAGNFEKKFEKLLITIQHNTSGKIICLPILPPNTRVEKEVPGTTKNYDNFNKIVRKLSNKYQVCFLNLDHLSPTPHYPDGTHFSQEGNKEVAESLFHLINENYLTK